MKKLGSLLAATLAVLTLVVAAPRTALAQGAPQPAPAPATAAAHPAWDKETLALAAELAIQDNGRVKPLDTYAGFKLLKLAGRRSCAGPDGSLTPIAWLLDCLFFPEQARGYPCFLIQNAEVLDRIGIAHENKGKRDRYTYDELAQGVDKLFQLAQELDDAADDRKGTRVAPHPEKDRDAVENQVVLLAHNVFEFEQLIHALDFTHVNIPANVSGGLKTVFKGQDTVGFAEALKNSKMLITLFKTVEKAENVPEDRKKAEMGAVEELLKQLDPIGQSLRHGHALALFPPTATATERTEWLAAWDIYREWMEPKQPLEAQVNLLCTLETAARSRGDMAALKKGIKEFHDGAKALADTRGEYSKIPLEVFFYRADFFYNALLAFVLSFVLAAISWTKPTNDTLWKGSVGVTAFGAVLVTLGIIFRCIIRSRPPVSTLYETILFISGVAVITCLVVEKLNRQRIASSVAAFLGMAGMFLANRYEFKDAQSTGDTMGPLVAVLDTNFWLATHVTSVTMGYSAGLLASAIAHVWLVGQMLGIRKGDTRFYKNIIRMVYGVLCFGLLFSTVGTILGGIWANYSWGRFWGWDPKENGALMIVLWELVIFHARLGGYIRDYGLSVLSILGGCVVAFSWWGVNLLGVGLHSYGFTSGIKELLMLFYGLEVLLALLSLGWWLAGQGQTQPVPPPPAPPESQPAP